MRSLLYVALAIWLVWLAPAPSLFAQTPPAPLSLADYQARLAQIAQQLAVADDAPTALVSAQAELAALQQVRLASGQIVAVPTSAAIERRRPTHPGHRPGASPDRPRPIGRCAQ